MQSAEKSDYASYAQALFSVSLIFAMEKEVTSMDDKNVMENILLLEKGVCDLYVHGVIESSTSNVHQTFSHALSDSLAMQDTLYDKMAAKGWYPTDRAEMTKVQAVKKKFQSMQG